MQRSIASVDCSNDPLRIVQELENSGQCTVMTIQTNIYVLC